MLVPLWGAAFYFLFSTLHLRLFDYDLWWQLANGRLMVENHIFPRVDLFSHTLRGTPWVNFEWLSQILLFLIVKMGGLPAIIVGKIILGFLIMGALALLLRSTGARGTGLFLLWMAGLLILKPRFYERVELVTLLMMPIFIGAVLAMRRMPLATARLVPWFLFFLMVFWTNMHGGFFYGVVAIVLLNIGARMTKENKQMVPLLDRAVVVVFLATFVNPFGPRIWDVFIEHSVQLFGGPSLIEEWAPPGIRETPAFWALFIIALAALVMGIFRNRPSAKFWAPAVLVFAVWGAQHQRCVGYFALVALPFLAELFGKHNRAKGSVLWPMAKSSGLLASLVLGGAIIFQTVNTPRASFDGIVQENRFPFGACNFIKKAGITGTMYNTYHLGGVIEWELGLAQRVFMDGRYIFQPLLVDHLRLDQNLYQTLDGRPWAAFLNSFHVDYAIIDYGTYEIPSQGRAPFPFAWSNLVFPRSEWALVYWDDGAMVFVKRIPAFAPIIKAYEYTTLWPNNISQMKFLLDAKQVPMDRFKSELLRHHQAVAVSVVRDEIEKCGMK